MARPTLTLPPDEAQLLSATYGNAGVILEYGSGGSTVLAAEMDGKTVFSVESDKAWFDMMRGWFAQNPPASRVCLHHADIGPTGDWGAPASPKSFRKWPDYPTTVWDRDDFVHPDAVLIDGRFRVACLLTVAFRIVRPVVALFDDYAGRPRYHAVEELLRPAAMAGRMARFDLVPQAIPADRLRWIVQFFQRPA